MINSSPLHWPSPSAHPHRHHHYHLRHHRHHRFHPTSTIDSPHPDLKVRFHQCPEARNQDSCEHQVLHQLPSEAGRSTLDHLWMGNQGSSCGLDLWHRGLGWVIVFPISRRHYHGRWVSKRELLSFELICLFLLKIWFLA